MEAVLNEPDKLSFKIFLLFWILVLTVLFWIYIRK